jgi:DNA-binding XRE family transcriptional regulator
VRLLKAIKTPAGVTSVDEIRNTPFFYLKRSIRAARALAGINQDELAALARVTRQTIGLMESTNKHTFPFMALDSVRARLQKIGVVFMPETEELGPALGTKVAGFPGQMLVLRGARALSGLRQNQLAELAGATRQIIARIECGDTSVPVIALEKVRIALEKEGVVFLSGTAGSNPIIALSKK